MFQKLVSAFLLFIVVLLPTSALADEQFLVVLGSYAQRDIAIEELKQFSPRSKNAPLTIMVKPLDSGTVYRIIDDAANSYQQALELVNEWQQRGHESVWILPGKLPKNPKPIYPVDHQAAIADTKLNSAHQY